MDALQGYNNLSNDGQANAYAHYVEHADMEEAQDHAYPYTHYDEHPDYQDAHDRTHPYTHYVEHAYS